MATPKKTKTRADYKYVHLRPNGKMTPEVKARIVEALAKCFTPVIHAHANGISYETYRVHLKEDPAFKAAVEEAYKSYAQSLRTEVHRRGVEGVDKNVYFKGVVVGKERQYSDALLLRAIARFDPSFRESTKIESKHSVTGGVAVLKDRLASLSPETRAALMKALEEEAKKTAPPPSPADVE